MTQPIICNSKSDRPLFPMNCPDVWWAVPVADLSKIKSPSRDHAYILPDDSVWIINYDGTEIMQLNGGGGSGGQPTRLVSKDDYITVSGSGTYTVQVGLDTAKLKDDLQITALENMMADHIGDTTIHVTAAEKSKWNNKQDKLIAGENITIENNVISTAGEIQVSYYIGRSTRLYIRFVSNEYIDEQDVVLYPYNGHIEGAEPIEFTITRGDHGDHYALECLVPYQELVDKKVFESAGTGVIDIMLRGVPRYQALQLDRYELLQKQDKLVSGTTIKTINGESLLGAGDITISGSDADYIDLAAAVSLDETNYFATEAKNVYKHGKMVFFSINLSSTATFSFSRNASFKIGTISDPALFPAVRQAVNMVTENPSSAIYANTAVIIEENGDIMIVNTSDVTIGTAFNFRVGNNHFINMAYAVK